MGLKAYLRAVEHYLAGLEPACAGASPGCSECGLDATDCAACDGTGLCQECNGEEPCDTCEGSGECYPCAGTGETEPDEEARQCADEGSFSWSQCDACGSTLGGDRYPAHALSPERLGRSEHWIHLDVCSDCLLFLANGDVPEDWRSGPNDDGEDDGSEAS
jgi:hypothetical protein